MDRARCLLWLRTTKSIPTKTPWAVGERRTWRGAGEGYFAKNSAKSNEKMKKIILVLVSVFTGYSSISGQIRLEWKIEEGKPLYYNAILDVSNTSSFEIKDTDLPKKIISEQAAQNFFDLFGKKPSYVVMRWKPKNVIDVKVSQRLEDSGMDSETVEAIKKQLGLEENVLLRGSVFSNGGICTYFIENQQKSLLSAAFELPTKEISKGDVWEIDFSCIDLKGVIITDTISRNVKVKADNVEMINADTVVTISYDLTEFMKGKRQISRNDFKEIGFEVKYIGIGKFSTNQGKWLDYDAVFTLESFGIMAGKMKGIFSLRPVDDIPVQYKQ